MDTCLMLSPAITFVIQFTKRIPFIANHPKVIATVLAAMLAAGNAWYVGSMPGWATLVKCVAEGLAGAVATHEVAVKPVLNTLAIGDSQ